LRSVDFVELHTAEEVKESLSPFPSLARMGLAGGYIGQVDADHICDANFSYAAFATFRRVLGLDVGGETFLSFLAEASAKLTSSVSDDPNR